MRQFTMILTAATALAALAGCVAQHGERAAFQHRNAVEVSAQTYTVHPPDVLRIHCPMATEIDGTAQEVRADGKISLRLLGEVDVAGLTPEQIAERLREKLARFYIDPDVVVEVPGQRSNYFYVLGEVASPGPRRITGRDTLLHAIAEARPTYLAWLSQVQLIRPGVNEQERTVVTVDVEKLTKKGDAREDVLLKVGDVIQVPPTPLAWVGLRVREVLFPISPVANAYAAPAGMISTNNIYQDEWGSGNAGSDHSNRWQALRP